MSRALLMAAGKRLFGIDLPSVREVLKAAPLFFVPRAPAGLLGAVNVHETVVPVFDMAALCGQAPLAEVDHVVVLQEQCLALAVTAVHGMCGRTLDAPAPAAGEPWVRRVFLCRRGVAGLVDTAVLREELMRQAGGGREAPPFYGAGKRDANGKIP
jgi:purine-binding chemotaxis protein CheW